VVPAATKRWSAAEHEAGLARLVTPGSRHRVGTVLAMVDRHRGGPKLRRRYQLIRDFEKHMDPRFTRPVDSKVVQKMLPILQAKGAPKMCYILSTDDNLDGRELPLDEALTIAIDHQGGDHVYLASCVPGRLGFYVDSEWYEARYILERPEGR
jgi:hypothetical protein